MHLHIKLFYMKRQEKPPPTQKKKNPKTMKSGTIRMTPAQDFPLHPDSNLSPHLYHRLPPKRAEFSVLGESCSPACPLI